MLYRLENKTGSDGSGRARTSFQGPPDLSFNAPDSYCSPQRAPADSFSSLDSKRTISQRRQPAVATRNRGHADSWNAHPWEQIQSKAQDLLWTFTRLNNQHRLKQIDASAHVLQTYHESFLFGRVPYAVKIRAGLRSGFIGYLWHVLEFIFALLSGVLYVYSTYNRNPAHNWVARTQDIVSIMFVTDYALRVYSEPVRFHYIFSFWGLIDLLSALPIIFLFNVPDLPKLPMQELGQRGHKTRGKRYSSFAIFAYNQDISLMSKIGVVGSTVTQQVLLLVVSTFGAVILVAGIIQWLEYDAAPKSKRDQCPETGCINFWDAFYFLIVTVCMPLPFPLFVFLIPVCDTGEAIMDDLKISTVGYGDITPKTQLGQLVTVVAIIGALVALPIQIGRITYLASRRPYGGSFNGRKVIDSRYLIVAGSISFNTVRDCLAEFYNPTHCEDLESYPLRVTILAPFSPSFELKRAVSLYHGLVKFIQGSPMRQSDLERVSAAQATAFFLLSNQEADDPKVEDAAQILKALAVHRFCGDRVRIIMELLEPESQTSAVWDETQTGGIEFICPVKIHYKMLSRSCVVKGLYTFITNLFTSEIKLINLDEQHFMSEYFHSFDNEVYPLIFPHSCQNMLFEEAVEFVFKSFNVVLFALDIPMVHKEKNRIVRKVFLYPNGHVIQPDDVGLVISRDLRTAYSISEYGDKNLKTGFFKNLWRNKQHQTQHPNTPEDRELLESVNTIPASPDGHLKLEFRLRSAMCHHNKRGEEGDDCIESGTFSGWHDECYGSDDAGSASSRSTEDTSAAHFPKGMSLEKATEKLLAWPPVPNYSQPHPSVLERRADVILQNLQKRTVSVVELKVPHILVCCQGNWPRHIFYFLKELRKPNFPNPPIVILHPAEPKAKDWGKVGMFNDVFFLMGSPIFELDLIRGGILQAERVVILADQGRPVDLSGDGVEDERNQKNVPSAYASDVDNILIAANVERLVGEKREIMVVEMQQTVGFYYLHPHFEIPRGQVERVDYKRNRNALIHFVPPVMEGKAVSPSFLGFLMRSVFYNRNTLSIVEQLVAGGGSVKQEGSLTSERVLDQIAVPEQYANRQYRDLFLGLLHSKGMLALGLYRRHGTLGSPTSYVFTNPPKETVVNAADLVYVIKQRR